MADKKSDKSPARASTEVREEFALSTLKEELVTIMQGLQSLAQDFAAIRSPKLGRAERPVVEDAIKKRVQQVCTAGTADARVGPALHGLPLLGFGPRLTSANFLPCSTPCTTHSAQEPSSREAGEWSRKGGIQLLIMDGKASTNRYLDHFKGEMV
ncbi:hypothetical protein Aduo_005850 [Ancylostoma duodenale]